MSLVALWGFAAFVTMRDGLNLLWVTRLDERVGQPSEALVDALQHERRITLERLGATRSASAARRAAEAEARKQTDAAATAFRTQTTSDDAQWAASDVLKLRIDELLGRLDRLPAVRQSIDSGNLSRDGTARAFGDLVEATFLIYGSLSVLDDEEIARYGRSLIALSRARELLAQEDALLAGVFANGRFTAEEITQFIQLAGARRIIQAQAAAELPEGGRVWYDEFVRGASYTRFVNIEEQIIGRSRARAAVPVTAAVWQSASTAAGNGLRQVVLKGAEDGIGMAKPVAVWVVVRLLLAGGLGLLAVVASIIVSITTARSLVRQLERLRAAAWHLARERLPDVVDRLGRGENVDVAAEAPPLAFGTDEIGQVGQAFNAVQRTAVRVAVQQAELRRSVRDVFLSLARRTQAMVHRQLTLLDAMERQDHEPAVLEDLFRIDHLATRMRRNAENLIVLSGATPGRAWRRSVPMVDVLRGAVAEVEDYTRVTVQQIEPAGLAGRAVGDLIHLVAELVENALSFSPPQTQVQISGQRVANGYAVEIEDRGLGMGEQDMVAANERIAQPPEFNLADASQLGLYVVSKLAERHGIRVRLKDSPYGGTTAVVLIPRLLVVDGTEPEPGPEQLLHRTPQPTNAPGAHAGLDFRNPAIAPPAFASPTPASPAFASPAFASPAPNGSGPEACTGDAEPGPSAVRSLGRGTAAGGAPVDTGSAAPVDTGSGSAVPDRRAEPYRTGDDEHPLEMPAVSAPDGQPGDSSRSAYDGFTPSGLPVRRRQASLPAPLAALPPGPPPTPRVAPLPVALDEPSPGTALPGAADPVLDRPLTRSALDQPVAAVALDRPTLDPATGAGSALDAPVRNVGIAGPDAFPAATHRGTNPSTDRGGDRRGDLGLGLGLTGTEAEDDFGRSPDDVRKIMSSYQAGTLRGRAEAAEPGDGSGPPSQQGTDGTR